MLSMKRFFTYAILIPIFLLICGCGGTDEADHVDAHGAIKASVATAAETRRPVIHEAVGTIQAKTVGTISAKLMGTVREVHIKEGDRIKGGDLLVTIDSRQVSAQLAQAESAVSEARQGAAAAEAAKEAARANADLATATYERYQKLLADESVSRQEYDEVTSRYRQALSALKQAEKMTDAAGYRVKQAESGLSAATVSYQDATVHAPYDGVVRSKRVEAGDLAVPGKPLLTIESIAGFEMAVDLPETLFKTVDVGKTVTILVSALNDLSLTGRISAMSPAADEQSRSFLVKVDLPENAPVHAGMFARARIPVGEEEMILVPDTAVLEQGHLTGIFILDDEGIARFRLIRTGRSDENGVEVISGLKPGVRFVIQPPPKLSDGMHVEAAS